MNKITPEINKHFGYDLDKTVDFFTLTRSDFLTTYTDLSDIEYNNTIIFWLDRIGMKYLTFKNIRQIDGIYIAKLYRNRGLDPLDLFILCS